MRTGTALLDGPRMRLDDGDGEKSIVWRSDRNVVWVLDHEDESYLEFEPPGPETLAGQIERRLDELEPEERAAVEGALGGAAGADPELDLHDTGRTDEVSGVPCSVLEVRHAARRVAEVCRATFAQAGIEPASFEALDRVRRLLESAIASLLDDELREGGIGALAAFSDLDGVPMRVRAYDGDALASETTVTRLRSRDFPDTPFELPADYDSEISIRIRKTLGGL